MKKRGNGFGTRALAAGTVLAVLLVVLWWAGPGILRKFGVAPGQTEITDSAGESGSMPLESRDAYRVVIATDMHLLADSLYDDGAAFKERMAEDDGKITPYVPQVLKAFMEEIMEIRPDAVILSGDLTYNGERDSHVQLAWMMNQVREQGIPVLVIPGNHDINNGSAARFHGEEITPVDPVTAEDFQSVYQGFGYDQAVSRDEFSLSYVYELGENAWIMMLDTNIYEPVNLVHGDISSETYEWMRSWLDLAFKQGISVLPVGHHNLLHESRLYTWACTIESRETALSLFEEYRIPLYISGHLHAARTRKNMTEPGMPKEVYGIHEQVNSALCVPPCQYGILNWNIAGEMEYEIRQVDVDGWAARHGETDENLLHFQEYSQKWFYQVIGGQVQERIGGSLPEETIAEMARTYADLLYRYGAGEKIDRREVKNSEGYQMWERYRPGDECLEEMEQILKD